MAVAEDGLLVLGKGRQRESVSPTVFLKGLPNGAQVGFTAVDEQQVGPFFLALRPPNDDFLHHS